MPQSTRVGVSPPVSEVTKKFKERGHFSLIGSQMFQNGKIWEVHLERASILSDQ